VPSAAFRFGPSGEHECKIVCDYLGKERYFVDGELVKEQRSMSMSGVREFTAKGYSIAVHVAVHARGATGKAFVNGTPVAENLFSEFNEMLADRDGGWVLLVRIIMWVLGALVVFAIVKSCAA
jgi:hypothetical protein